MELQARPGEDVRAEHRRAHMNSRDSIFERVYSGFRRAVVMPAALVFLSGAAALLPLLHFSLTNLRHELAADQEKRMTAAAARARDSLKSGSRSSTPPDAALEPGGSGRLLVMKVHRPGWLLPGTKYPGDYTRESIRRRFARNFAGISIKADLRQYLNEYGDTPEKQIAHFHDYMQGRVARVVYPLRGFGNTLNAPGERDSLRMAVTGNGFLKYGTGRFAAYRSTGGGGEDLVVALLAPESGSLALVNRLHRLSILLALVIALVPAFLVFAYLSGLGRRTRAAESALRNRHKEERAAAERFVPHDMLKLLAGAGPMDVKGLDMKGGESARREVTILAMEPGAIGDSPGGFMANLAADEIFRIINDYALWAASLIEEQGGFMHRVSGYAWEAWFPEGPEGALRAAAAIRRQLADFNAGREKAYYESPVMGIHTGAVNLGLMGRKKSPAFAIVSETERIVNRVRRLADVMGADIACGEESLYAVENPDEFRHRFLGTVPTLGRERISVFEIFEGADDSEKALKSETRLEFENGIERFYAREFAAAAELFAGVLEKNPGDGAAKLYLKRSREHI